MPKTTLVMIECDFCYRSTLKDDCQETSSGVIICDGCFDKVVDLAFVHYKKEE